MMKPLQLKTLDRRELQKIANHAFFASAALMFVAQQAVLHSAPAPTEAAMIAQALNLQPRTPPPVYDLDQLSGNEIEPAPSADPRWHALAEPGSLVRLAPVGVEAPAGTPSGPTLTREDAPDRSARALPPRERPE